MAGGAILSATADVGRVEAPVTMKAYLMCAFAAFGGVCSPSNSFTRHVVRLNLLANALV